VQGLDGKARRKETTQNALVNSDEPSGCGVKK
jgi:hypothetical protein